MRKIKIIDEIKTIKGALSYRVFEEQSRNIISYGLEIEYECNGEIYRKIFYNVSGNKKYALKMNCEFAEKVVLPENIEETAEEYVQSEKE